MGCREWRFHGKEAQPSPALLHNAHQNCIIHGKESIATAAIHLT